MYTDTNFKTKKELKDAIAAGKRIGVFQPNDMGMGQPPKAGDTVYLEGPHYPQPHKWYAQAKLGADGCIDSVK